MFLQAAAHLSKFMLQVLQMLQEYFRQQQEHSEAMEQLLSLADKLSLSTTTEEVGSTAQLFPTLACSPLFVCMSVSQLVIALLMPLCVCQYAISKHSWRPHSLVIYHCGIVVSCTVDML